MTDFLDSVFNTPPSQKSVSSTTNNVPIRFDPFADSIQPASNSTQFESNTNVSKINHPPKIDTTSDIDRDEGNFAIFSPVKGKPKSVTIKASSDDFDMAGQGMVLGRVSKRSLLMCDWTPFFYVVKLNSDIRYYEDPHFLKKNRPDDYSILIYRERYSDTSFKFLRFASLHFTSHLSVTSSFTVHFRCRDDYENNPMGQHIKKVIPIRPNYCCGEVKCKSYSGMPHSCYPRHSSRILP
jgi:hypothetical protein